VGTVVVLATSIIPPVVSLVVVTIITAISTTIASVVVAPVVAVVATIVVTSVIAAVVAAIIASIPIIIARIGLAVTVISSIRPTVYDCRSVGHRYSHRCRCFRPSWR
jgi:hypothetical protein